MASFQFRALQPDGGVAEGTLEAPDRREALRLIAARGLRPVKLSDSASSATGYAPAARSTPQKFLSESQTARVANLTRRVQQQIGRAHV